MQKQGENIFLCNGRNHTGQSGTSVEIEYPASKTPLHFLQISFSAELLKRLSDEQTDLESCFHVVPYQVVVIQAESEISMLIKIFRKGF